MIYDEFLERGVYGKIVCIAFLLVIQLVCRIATASGTDDKKSRREYIINPGDQLLITVVGYEKELTAPVVVRPDGMVTCPVVGDVEAAGFTIAQLSSAIREQLSKLDYYKNPQVTVQLKESRQELIYVFGDVVNPGQKSFASPVTVIKALAAAGGFKETADLANARIVKGRTREVIPVDLKNVMDQGVCETMMEDGDVLIILSAVKEKQVNIIGQVLQPGQYSVRSAISLIEALAIARGPLENRADLKHIIIIRANGELVITDATLAWTQPQQIPHQDEGSYQSLLIQPGDSVLVPEKGKINVLGSVVNQGQIVIDGKIGVIEALALAGIKENVDLKKLLIVRSTGEQVVVDASKLWKQPGQYAGEELSTGDTLVVPPKHVIINWNAVSATVMIFSTLYAVFKK